MHLAPKAAGASFESWLKETLGAARVKARETCYPTFRTEGA